MALARIDAFVSFNLPVGLRKKLHRLTSTKNITRNIRLLLSIIINYRCAEYRLTDVKTDEPCEYMQTRLDYRTRLVAL